MLSTVDCGSTKSGSKRSLILHSSGSEAHHPEEEDEEARGSARRVVDNGAIYGESTLWLNALLEKNGRI